MIDENQPTPEDHRTSAPPSGAILFVLCFALLIVGFVLMGMAFNDGNGFLFGLGILLSGVAFMIPISLGSRN